MTTDKNNSYIEKLAAGISKKAVQDAIKAVSGKGKEAKTATTAVATAKASPVAAAQVAMTEKAAPTASAPTATTEEAAPETAAQAAIVIETKADPAADAKCAYIFFNCDASKATASMNIRFNDEVYRDYPVGSCQESHSGGTARGSKRSDGIRLHRVPYHVLNVSICIKRPEMGRFFYALQAIIFHPAPASIGRGSRPVVFLRRFPWDGSSGCPSFP